MSYMCVKVCSECACIHVGVRERNLVRDHVLCVETRLKETEEGIVLGEL